MVDKVLARLLWWLPILFVGCVERNVDLKPIMPRDGSPILLCVHSPEVRPTLEAAVALWAELGVNFSFTEGEQSVDVRVTEDLPEGKNGRYEWIPFPNVRVHPGAADHLPTVAHELGHVLGVRHLRDDECGIMSVIDCGREEISADDVKAFLE